VALELLEKIALIDQIEPWPLELINSMVPEVKVIYSDVDRTLLGPGGSLFMGPDYNYTGKPAQAVLRCHLHNIDVVLISGRGHSQLREDARILGFKNWISELGCQISYNMGEVMILNIGDFPAGEATVWQTIMSSGAPDFLLNKYKGYLEYHIPWSDNREFTHIFRGWIDIAEINGLLQDQGFEQLKIVDNGKILRRSSSLDPRLTEIHAYHLLPKASGKASAVRKDRETRGIPKNKCAAIGDSISDLEIASEVGILFLVRNAITDSPEILEKVGDYPNVFITQGAMGLGWAEAVNFLIDRRLG